MSLGSLALLLPAALLVLLEVSASLVVRSRRDDQLVRKACDDFTVLVPIYGNIKYLENIDFLAKCGGEVVLCTTSGESAEFLQGLRSVARQHGFKVFLSRYSPPVVKQRRTGGVVRDRVVRDALEVLFAKRAMRTYCICIDADTTSPRPLRELTGALVASGADFASVDLVPQRDGPILVQLQRHEYRMSMRLRYLSPWMLSGACHIGKTEVFHRVMALHSLFFQGNDMETGLLADALGYRAVHLPFKVDTNVPAGLRQWWRQRIAWGGGEFRIFVVNFRLIFRHPILWIYGSIVALRS